MRACWAKRHLDPEYEAMKPRLRRKEKPSQEAVVQRFSIDVAHTIVERKLLHGGERCVVAVSGGPDSLALLHVMHRLRSRFMLTLHVAHLDHGMREDSAEDASFVEAQAVQLGMTFNGGLLKDPKPAGRSPEEHLAVERSNFLHGIANELGAARILTGHTLDDQAETVLGNLITGAGRRGLGGMPPARWRVARPLIDRTRAEIEGFCAALNLEPRIDSTNTDAAFRRNRIRHELLPSLAKVNPRVNEQLAQLSEVSRAEDYLLDGLASKAVHIVETEHGTSLKVEDLLAAPLALQRRAIRLLARNEHVGITFAQSEALLRLAHEGREGSSIDLDGALSGWRKGGLLTVGRDQATEEPTEKR